MKDFDSTSIFYALILAATILFSESLANFLTSLVFGVSQP